MTLGTFSTIVSIIGIPSLITLFKMMYNANHRIKILMVAQQKQMRRDLMEDYHRYKEQGWISDDDLETFEEGYQAYHSLGKNGVMDAKRDELLALPNTAPVKI